jgi:hypothetical protein
MKLRQALAQARRTGIETAQEALFDPQSGCRVVAGVLPSEPNQMRRCSFVKEHNNERYCCRFDVLVGRMGA